MHEVRAVGDHLDALVDQSVDDAANALLVAGNGAGGIDHQIAARQRHVGMLILGDARKCCARFALAAGAKRHDLVGRQITVGIDRAHLRHVVPIAGLARDLDAAIHGAADNDHFAIGGARGGGNRAQTPDVGSKRRHRDAAARVLHQFGNRLGDIGFRGRAALAHRIGGIADDGETALFAERAQFLLVGAVIEHRR